MANHSAIKAALKAKLDELRGRASAVEGHLSTPGSSDWDDNATESEDDDVLLTIGDVTSNDIAEIQLAISRIELDFPTIRGRGKWVTGLRRIERVRRSPGRSGCVGGCRRLRCI